MSVEITVPALGESIVEATVGKWLKQPGQAVTAGEAVVELETEKVNAEVPAPQSGVLQSIAKQEGDTVGIGDVLATMDESTQAAAPAEGAASAGASSVESTPGRPEAAESRETPGPATSGGNGQKAGPETGEIEAPDGGRASPVAKRLAAEHDIDLSRIHGTGPGGRVKREDVEGYLQQLQAAPAAGEGTGGAQGEPGGATAEAPSTPAPAVAVPSLDGRFEERVRMSRRRQTIARRLVEAQHTAAMLTTFNEVDMSAVMALRAERRDAFKERHGIGLGFMSFFTKAVIGALKAFPRLNAEIQGDEMVLKRYYDIGIAVGTDEGLVVPVVRNADRLTFAEIEQQIADLANKARNRSLSLEDLQGGTFTISNGGIYGSLLSTPILNGPQVGILGMHKIEQRPIALNGEVVIRPMMYLALSYDHRIVDGSEAVRFLVTVKELIEDPTSLLLEG